ncbi:constitutive coactivator of peroxisome proliferator-activated receptor gamma-like [Thrips palmi]|uniref:Constitutive coactivator of peroxisome proliferator-activated receptor gamma-like n=1 Tax=Thrips palmi TaxID=161013 RepID=A0A6P8ZW01_THRPL|nr:constitutive coactivator of peroxisome proliferator-activated receptor gamma-like [Thrips palmi]
MGVRRLQTYLEQYCPDACYEVSIEQIANNYRQTHNKEPVIVVDGSCCYRKLYGGLDWVCGGQYKEHVDSITKFIDSFERLGIKLVLYFDGATQESKRPVWVSRRLQSMEKAHAIFDALKAGQEVKRMDKELYVLPAGAGSVMSSISRTRCMVQRSLKECDEEITEYAARNKCFAILAQDSDFVIYKNGADYYLSSENLNIDTMTTLVYDKEALARHLNLDVRDLPVFASLMGNDFIPADDLKPFHNWLMGKRRHKNYVQALVLRVADFVYKLPKGNDLFSCLRELSYDIFRTPHRAKDLRQSILSYVKSSKDILRIIDNRCEKWDKILSVAHDNYISMASPSYVYNILRKLPFEMSTALEDCRITVQPSAAALRLMRQRIYGVALREYPGGPDGLVVEEWCMSGPQSLKCALKVNAILPPDDSPLLLDLWFNDSEELIIKKFKLLAWIGSFHLTSTNLHTLPHPLLPAVIILSYLYHDAGILLDWEVKVFAAVIIDVQIMESKELSAVTVNKVDVRGVQLATLFTRSITHLGLANSICGNPIEVHWTRHPQLFDGKLFQISYLNGKSVPPSPKRGNIQQFNQLCDVVLKH